MEKENKDLQSITDKFYADAQECFGNDLDNNALILLGMQGDHCVSSMIGLGKSIVGAITNAMLQDDRIAKLFLYAVKEYKITTIMKDINPDKLKSFMESLEKKEKDQEGK